MKLIVKFCITLVAVVAIYVIALTAHTYSKPDLYYPRTDYSHNHENLIAETHKKSIYRFIQNEGYAPVCIVVDFSRHSGKERFYVYDAANDIVDYSATVAHGRGRNNEALLHPRYSNEPGSYLSSLGKYKIGIERKMYSHNLRCFELDGLESTNSNARYRGILIHEGMPQLPTYPLPCPPVSEGCFVISGKTFTYLSSVVDQMEKMFHKPVLLYCYCS